MKLTRSILALQPLEVPIKTGSQMVRHWWVRAETAQKQKRFKNGELGEKVSYSLAKSEETKKQ